MKINLKSVKIRWYVLAIILFAAAVTWGELIIPNTFTAGTVASAADMNVNFDAVKTEVDGKIDGVLAGTGLTATEVAGTVTVSVAAGGITGAEIANGSIGPPDLGTGAVTSIHILDGTITGDDIALDTILAGDIAANAVGASEIAAAAVGSSEVADNSLTASDLAANSVGASELATNAVTSVDILDSTITGADIAANTIGTADIATNGAGASEIAASAVGASELASNAVTAVDTLDEAGVHNAYYNGFVNVSSTSSSSPSGIESEAISYPASGRLMAIATGSAYFSLSSGQYGYIGCTIGTASGQSFTYPIISARVENDSGVSQTWYVPFTLTTMFTVSGSGTTTYWLNCWESGTAGTNYVYWPQMTLMYFATQY